MATEASRFAIAEFSWYNSKQLTAVKSESIYSYTQKYTDNVERF